MNAQTPVQTAPDRARKLQIRGPLSDALDYIAMQGQTQREAARRAGMNETALSRAIAKPHVAAELEARKQQAAFTVDQLKGMAKAAALRVGLDLMHNSPDHKVRAKMVELFAGEARQPSVAVQINNAPAHGYEYRKPDTVSSGTTSQDIEGKAE